MRFISSERWVGRSGLATLVAVVLGCASIAGARAQGGPLISSRWTLGSQDSTRSWSAGKTKDLSEWKTVSCPSQYGDRFLLTGLTGFKEPWSNLDNFIAALKATCTEFERKSQHTATVFTSANHRDTAYELDAFDWQGHADLLCPAYYDAGPMAGNTGMIGAIEIGTNPGEDYVQNFRFFARCARLNADETIQWLTTGDSNQMIGDNGYVMFHRTRISCPSDDYVVTGVELRFELGKGKVRELRLQCRQLVYAP